MPVCTKHSTASWFCVTVFTALFYSLNNVCQYLTLYRLTVLCHYVHCCLLQSIHCLSVPHRVPSANIVSLCLMLSSTVCPLSVNNLQCTVCRFCVTKTNDVFYILSTVCQYITLYRLLVLCHCVHCSLLQSVQCLSVPHTILPLGSVSL